MKKPTVGLYLIVKDEYEQVARLVTSAQDHAVFDEINITVSDKSTADKLNKLFNEKNTIFSKSCTFADSCGRSVACGYHAF